MRQHPTARLAVTTLLISVFASGCTWVHMAPGASEVRVIAAGGAPEGCERRGEIAVSVKDSVAFYERNDLRVREELETLARNEGPGLDADTIQPLGSPVQGDQRFTAYRCGAGANLVPGAQRAPGMSAPGGAVTYPVGG